MKTIKTIIIVAISFCSLGIFAQDQKGEVMEASKAELQRLEQTVENRYILKLKSKIETRDAKTYADAQKYSQAFVKGLLAKHSIQTDKISHYYFGEFSGFAGNFSIDEITKLKSTGLFDAIEKDGVVTINSEPTVNAPLLPPPPQQIDWGVKRVYQQSSQPFCCPPTNNCKKIAYVIDTGVDMTHPDLMVHAAWSNSFVASEPTANDLNGHGSHVAGIIAANDNNIGSRGIAPGTTVVSIKVLNQYGSGTFADVIWGVNYVAFMADYVKSTGVCLQVANMSLSGSGCNTLMSSAVQSMANKGVFITLAAGNNFGQNASTRSPACTNGQKIYTVASVDVGDIFSNFSNLGLPPVDCAAPGRNIFSLWKNGGYNTISGTSMAAPHVAGILLANNGVVRFDTYAINPPDGKKYPVAQVCGRSVVSTTANSLAMVSASTE